MGRKSRLKDGEVQVWHVDAASAAPHCWQLLLTDEIRRARGIRAEVARDEFVAGRGVLRLLLARELGCSASAVRIGVGEQGKPEVLGVEFNVAHSRGVVLIALSRAGVVGIDIEHEDREVEALEIARGSFHPEEVGWIEREGVAAFYRCWTRKEAVVKADGRGLLLPLNDFSVCPKGDIAGEEAVDLKGKEDGNGYLGVRSRYYVRELDLGDGMVASLALTRAYAPVSLFLFAALKSLKSQSRRLVLRSHASFLHRVMS